MNVNNVRSKKEAGLARRMREAQRKCCRAARPRPVDFLSHCSAPPQPSDLDSVQAFPVSPGDPPTPLNHYKMFSRKEDKRTRERKTNANTGAAPDHFGLIKCDRLIFQSHSKLQRSFCVCGSD